MASLLEEFISTNRDTIIERCRNKVAMRSAPPPTADEISCGVPVFLTQLEHTLRLGLDVSPEIGQTASQHGDELLARGFTVSQVVHDYGDVCQAITDLAIETDLPISADDFRTLNRCLDDAIAGAMTAYGRDPRMVDRERYANGDERLAFLVHELHNLTNIAIVAFEVMKTGNVGVGGSTGGVLERSLLGLRTLIGHSMAAARLAHDVEHRESFEIAKFMEVTVLMPCLNEADTLATCIRKARNAMSRAGIEGEVVVANNGSTDDSPAIARDEGARLVLVADRGYGAALMGGIAAARGRFVIMGDADDSYDFGEVPAFVERLRDGYDLVQGCRLESGGGRVLPGAMPLLHRWLGNPVFSRIARRWFRTPVHDIYCGFRGFKKTFYQTLDQRCTGMEFATEMIIKASLSGARISEVPITLHPDGRTSHPPHLKTVRDGWRTLRFFLMCTPRRLFLMPGLTLVVLGLAGFTVAMPGMTIGRITFDAHTLLFASLAVICGSQSMFFALIAKTFAITEGLLPADSRIDRFARILPLERGLLLGTATTVLGGVMLVAAVNVWRIGAFGRLNYADTMRVVVPGVTLVVLGYQTVLSCFFICLLGMRRR